MWFALGHSKYKGIVAIVVALAVIPLVRESLQGQTERSLRIWGDTLDLNVCNERSFDSLGVWLQSAGESDTIVGFSFFDSVYAVTMTLRWDTSHLRLQGQPIMSPQTLFGRFQTRSASLIDTVNGLMWITAANESLSRFVVGQNIPLFYLRGYVRGEDTLAPPLAGVQVQSIEIEGFLGDNMSTLRFVPGFVRVSRDTTPEYTGTLMTTPADLDTNQLDTISVVLDNVGDRRVTEIHFTLNVDTGYVAFVDTVEVNQNIAGGWASQTFQIFENQVMASFVANGELVESDLTLCKLILERRRDSSIVSQVDIEEFRINTNSCLGRLLSEGSEVRGKAIPKVDTTDTTDTWVRRLESSEGRVIVASDGTAIKILGTMIDAEEVRLYDELGREVKRWEEILPVSGGWQLECSPSLKSGVYFLGIIDAKQNIWYKQFYIQTK